MSDRLSFAALAETFEAMRATRSPKMKEALLGELFLEIAVDARSLESAARFCSADLLPAGDPRSVGVGWALILEVASALTGFSPAIVSACSRTAGDLGEAIALLIDRMPGASDRKGPTLVQLADLFEALASTSRRAEKGALLYRALSTCTPVEAKYLLRALGAGLRIGAQQTLILAAIARAFERDIESVRWAFARTGDAGTVALLACEDRLASAAMVIGRPAAFMLATPHENVKTPLNTELTVVEDKLDGIRAQVHKRGSEVSIFARGMASVTTQFPEIVDAIKSAPGSVALDGEIIATTAEGRPRPFMVLAERIHRKTPTRAQMAAIPVTFAAYDLLADDDGEALDLPWEIRRKRLEHFLATLGPSNVIVVNEARPMGATSLDEAFRAARERGHEGLVLKRTDAFYEAGRRTMSWIKLKRALSTIDCVITAAEEGHGKRAGVWSDYTFAVWKGDELVNIGKAYSGLTDEEIEFLTARLRSITTERFGRAHLVKPEIVLEIAFDGVQRSKRHKSGFALRFPRIARIRDDKTAEQADTLENVQAIYAAQLETGHREEPAPPADKPKTPVRQPTPARKKTNEKQLSFNFDEARKPQR